MRKTKEEKIQKKYFQLRRQASLNRMVDGELAFKIIESINKVIDKLEVKFPEFKEAYNFLGI